MRFAFAGLTSLVIGCQAILGFDDVTLRGDSNGAGGQPQGGSGLGGQANHDISLAAMPTSVRVVRGASTDVGVTVTRTGFDGPVIVRFDNLPSGVTSLEATVAAGETMATLTLSADAQAALGPATLSLVDADMLAAPVDVPLMVADPPGTLDNTFDNDGVALIAPNGSMTAVARRAIVQPDGSIVAAGTASSSAGWAMVRLMPDGSPDTAFNTNVLAALPADGALRAIAFDAVANKIVGCGQSSSQITVLRLNLDGTADQAFGASGIAKTSMIVLSQGAECHAVVVQPDSRIIAAGYHTIPSDPEGVVARFTTDGQIDNSFNGSGYFSDKADTRFFGVVLDGDRIVVGGDDQTTIPEFYARRLLADGTVDATYGSGGSVTWTGGVVYTTQAVSDAAGRFTLCGYDGGGIPENAVGALDPNGAQLYPPPGKKQFGIHGNNDRFYGCVAQPGGYLLAAGFGFGAESHQTYVARLDPNGDLDMSFGDMGTTSFLYNMTMVTRSLYGVTLQPDGRIVAVGTQVNAGFVVVRIWD